MSCETMKLRDEARREARKIQRETPAEVVVKPVEETSQEIYKKLFEKYYKEKNPEAAPIEYVAPEILIEEVASEEGAVIDAPRNVVLLDEFFDQGENVTADITFENGDIMTVTKERISVTSGDVTQDLGPKDHVHDENPFNYLPYVVVGQSTKVKLNSDFKEKESLIPSSPVKRVKFSRQDSATSARSENPVRNGGTNVEVVVWPDVEPQKQEKKHMRTMRNHQH